MRLRFRSLAIVASRMRLALPGVGTSFHRSEQPGGVKVAFKLEHGGKVAPKLLTHAVCEPVALGAKIFGDARPFAQFDNSGIGSGEQPEAARIDAQGGGHDFRIAAVIFGSCQSKAVVKSIHLVGVDGVI